MLPTPHLIHYRCSAGRHLEAGRRGGKRALTLMEVVAVSAIIGVMISSSAPSFRRAIERSRADVATANLQAIWSAQRLYWLETRSYAEDLSVLQSAGLLGPTIVGQTGGYVYTISDADSKTFTAVATRRGSTQWNGEL